MDKSLANRNDEPVDDAASEPTPEPAPESLELQAGQWRKTVKKKNKHEKTRRGYGRKNSKDKKNGKNKLQFSLLGSNINGLNTKKESLFHAINKFKPSVVTLQESKVKKSGSIKIPGYQIFEKLRNGKGGGGLLTAVDEDLAPVLVSTGDDEVDTLTVETSIGNN